MRIAIIGAGWYGCHIATELLKFSIDVDIFEAQEDIFMCASKFNGYRLHQGFHYPRSYITRQQSRDGFILFLSRYPDLSEVVSKNVFAVALKGSFIDFETYVQIMAATNLTFQIRNPDEFNLQNVSGALTCDERLVATDRAIAYFRRLLKTNLHLDSPVETLEATSNGVLLDGSLYDVVVNCTYGTFQPLKEWDIFYQPCVVLVYRGDPSHPALTIMDGPFMSIYPYKKDLFSVACVQETPRGNFTNFEAAQIHRDRIDSRYIGEVRERMEKIVKVYYPSFDGHFKYVDFFTCIKTKVSDSTEGRACIVREKERVIQVMSGKIDTIFYAATEVLKCVKKYC